MSKMLLSMSLLSFAILGAMVGGADAQTNSYANMLGTIQMQNQAYYNQFNSYNRQFGGAARDATPSGPQAAPQQATPRAAQQPLLPQFPIAATDFRAAPNRLVPDQLAGGAPGLSLDQKLALRDAYVQFLDEFERSNRKSNLAAALSYAVRMSLRAVYGKDMTQVEINQLGWNLNSAFAMNAEFNTMAPQQKQALYENLIITAGTITYLQSQGAQQNNPGMQAQAKELGQMLLKQWGSL